MSAIVMIAAAVPVADKLWVLGLAHRSAAALPLAATVACGLAGLALVLAGVVLLFRRRRSRAEVDQVEAGAAVAAATRASFQAATRPTRTTSFPLFSPRNSIPSPIGACSKPSSTCRRCLRLPSRSRAASHLRASS